MTINPHFRYRNLASNSLAMIAGYSVRLPFRVAAVLLSPVLILGTKSLLKGIGSVAGGIAGLAVKIPVCLAGHGLDCMRMATKGTFNLIGLRTPSNLTLQHKIARYGPGMRDMRLAAAEAATGHDFRNKSGVLNAFLNNV